MLLQTRLGAVGEFAQTPVLELRRRESEARDEPQDDRADADRQRIFPHETAKPPAVHRADELKKVGDNIKDAVDETRHREAAEVEREERELNGDVMTPGENSVDRAREAEHDVLADVDRAKRAIRKNT